MRGNISNYICNKKKNASAYAPASIELKLWTVNSSNNILQTLSFNYGQTY